MNNYRFFLIYLFISILFIFIQTSLISPKFFKYFTPDLNLILIIYLATANNVYGSLHLTIINGLFMDLFTGYTLGINTLTRLTIYAIFQISSKRFNFNKLKNKVLSIFLGTTALWILLFIIFKFQSIDYFDITLSLIICQATTNAVFGILIIFLFNKTNAKL